MLKSELRKAKLNNHGFSLVELLIAMAILGVCSLVIYSFMMQGSRFYGKQYADADIQSEAQLVANTITDLIVDCEVNISYDENISNSINPDDPSSGVVYAEGKALEISNSDYQFIIFHNDSNLYYLERRPSAADPSVYEPYNIENAELLAENITEFDVDLSRVSGKGKGKNIVTFTMTYESTGRSYRGNYQVNLRNDISVSGNALTPLNDEANCTTVVVSPNPYRVDVRGKENPVFYLENTDTVLLGKDFTANSDVVNAGRENIYDWTVEDKDGNLVDYITANGATDENVYHAVFNHADSVPAYVKVVATSTVANKATGAYPRGEAVVYFKKLLEMNIAPTSGVTENQVSPLGTAVFTTDMLQYNMTSADMRCAWTLEYKLGDGAYMPCNNAAYATGTMLDTGYSSRLGRRVGTSFSVRLGDKAKDEVTFRVTAINAYDGTFEDQYEFTVTKQKDEPGPNRMSRGVEVDLEEFFKNDAEGQESFLETIKEPFDEDVMHIYKVVLIEGSNYDAHTDLYNVIERDGKWYIYLDFNAWAKPDNQLSYYDSHAVEMELYVMRTDGKAFREPYYDPDHPDWNCMHQTANFNTQAVRLSPALPYAGTSIVIPKGGSYDASCSVTGYNISNKNTIGIYAKNASSGSWVNSNANTVGMVEVSPYLNIEYTSALGTRYTLVDKANFRLTAKTTRSDYPTESIPMMVTLDKMYQLAKSKNNSSYIERSSYTFDVYIANVEGQNVYIQGPKSLNDLSTWKVNIGDEKTTTIDPTDKDVTVNITSPSEARVTFRAVKNNGVVSYYEMDYNGSTYYWNSTYNYWKKTN